MKERENAVRLFVAFESPASFITWLATRTDAVRRTEGDALYRWISGGNLHLTLHFLGDTPEERIPQIAGAMQSVAAAVEPFPLRPGMLEFFPGVRNPRVMVVSMEDRSDTALRVHAALADELSAMGISVDRRPYRPHITLAYVRRSASRPLLRESTRRVAGATPEDATDYLFGGITLIQSTLAPGGSIYRERARAEFGRPTTA